MHLHNIVSDNPKELAEYDNEISATMIARYIDHFNNEVIMSNEKTFAQTYSLKKGIRNLVSQGQCHQ